MRNAKEPATWRPEGDIDEQCKKTVRLQLSETDKETEPQREAAQIAQRLGGTGRHWEEFWICCKFNEKSEKDFNQERDMSWYWAKEVTLTNEDKEKWIV